MRGAKAKAIRSLAMQATVGQPWARWAWQADTCTRKITNPEHPKYGETIVTKINRIVLHPKCGKAAYRKLKTALARKDMTLRRRRDRERVQSSPAG